MAIPFISDDVKIISKLADKPNETNGLTADQLKARFDEAPSIIKSFINSTIIPALNENYISDGEAETLLSLLETTGDDSANKMYGLLFAIVNAILGREAPSATKLSTARKILVNLDSSSADDFDGAADASPGVNGTLDIEHGGTGSNTAAKALDNLGGVDKEGDIMTGILNFAMASPEIRFYAEGLTNRMFVLSTFESGDSYETRFYAYAPNGYYQSYYLPVPPSAPTTNAKYALLTTRDAVTISQGGTGARTAAEALSNLGGASITKLWENASPSSSFAAQTVSLDLSSYGAVLIFAKDTGSTGNTTSPLFLRIGDKGVITRHISTYSTSFGQRGFSVSESGVEVGTAVYCSYNGSAATDNGEVVPYQIYGIKGVQ